MPDWLIHTLTIGTLTLAAAILGGEMAARPRRWPRLLAVALIALGVGVPLSAGAWLAMKYGTWATRELEVDEAIGVRPIVAEREIRDDATGTLQYTEYEFMINASTPDAGNFTLRSYPFRPAWHRLPIWALVGGAGFTFVTLVIWRTRRRREIW